LLLPTGKRVLLFLRMKNIEGTRDEEQGRLGEKVKR
jgi:hypothetical protein